MGVTFCTEQPLTAQERAELDRLTLRAARLPFLPEDGEAKAAYDAAWEAVRMADPASYWTNSVGLWAISEQMEKLGMLGDVPEPDLPRPEDFGLECHPNSPEDREEGDEPTDAERRFLGAWGTALLHDAGTGPIPRYKLNSDVSWLITPREVQAGLDAYRGASGTLRLEASGQGPWWDNWIRFLEGVPQRGGMRLG